MVRRAACSALAALARPVSLKPLAAALSSKKDPALADAARSAIEGLDYSAFLRPGEAAVKVGPVLRKRRAMQRSLKALILTSSRRLLYVDSDARAAKPVDFDSLEAEKSGDLVVGKGEKAVRLAPIVGAASDWIQARTALNETVPSAPAWGDYASPPVPAAPARYALDASRRERASSDRWRV